MSANAMGMSAGSSTIPAEETILSAGAKGSPAEATAPFIDQPSTSYNELIR
jgi:hypothetical protein